IGEDEHRPAIRQAPHHRRETQGIPVHFRLELQLGEVPGLELQIGGDPRAEGAEVERLALARLAPPHPDADRYWARRPWTTTPRVQPAPQRLDAPGLGLGKADEIEREAVGLAPGHARHHLEP